MKSSLHRGLLLSLAAISFVGCARSTDATLSAAGHIRQDAPVQAHLQIDIAASPSRVWGLLIDAPSWPHWATQIDTVDAPGPLAAGTHFTWHSGGTAIHSVVHLCEPQRRLSWTGTALTAKAIHVWQLQPTATGTRVIVDESMSGPLMSWLYPSAKLAESDTDWLNALKQAAEHNP